MKTILTGILAAFLILWIGPRIDRAQTTADGPTAFYSGSGYPEGYVKAHAGAMYIDASSGNFYFKSQGEGATGWTALPQRQSSSLPSGAIVLILSGSCPAGLNEVSALQAKTLVGTIAANADVGATGGSSSITPAGTNSAPALSMDAYTPGGANSWPVSVPTFAGSSNQSTSAVSAGTPAGTNSAPALSMNAYTPAGTNGTVSFTPAGTNGTVSFTPAGTNGTVSFTPAGTNGTVSFTPAGTIAWPAGVPTFSGNALGTHTHGAGTLADATSGSTVKLFTSSGSGVSAATLSGSTAAVSAGTPAGTVAWPAGVPTLSGTSGTVGAEAFTGSPGTVGAETFTGSPGTVGAETFTGTQATLTGSVAAPTFTGSALGTHSHTITPAGTIAWPISVPAFAGAQATLTGSVAAPTFAGNSFDPHPPFAKVIFCQA